MERYLYNQILKDLKKKMVMLTGPRQVGKTTLAKQIMSRFQKPLYLNYDTLKDYEIIRAQSWTLNTDLLVFDEIHKMKNWKKYLKGIYDGKRNGQAILVTGSARMETFRQTGDSLAGRYFHFKLNPLSVKELGDPDKYSLIEKLIRRSGFPEPFFAEDETGYPRWQNQYYTDLVREDVMDFSRIHEVKVLRLLLEMLRNKVGSPISSLSLSRDLQVSPITVRKYIEILESLYIIILVRPFHKNIARAMLKEPKIYFYDSAYVNGDFGLKLENFSAQSLLKHIEFENDNFGKKKSLHYIRTKDGKEVDFAIASNGTLEKIIEVKLSDEKISKSLIHFKEKFPAVSAVQIVHNLEKNREHQGIEIIPAGEFFNALSA